MVEFMGLVWWYTPVIPATWKMEIGRIAVQGQSGEII
jgi:hypothetical protein